MALLNRLTNGEEPRIGLHSWHAALNEYARGEVSPSQIKNGFGIENGDSQGLAMIALIDNETEIVDKLAKVSEINDVLIIHSNADTRSLYPDVSAIATRLLG